MKPLYKEIDYNQPCEMVGAFANRPWCLWLDSAVFSKQARYSYLLIEPLATLYADESRVYWQNVLQKEHPFRVMEKALHLMDQTKNNDLPPFQGGFAGYWGFECHRFLELTPTSLCNDQKLPDCALGFYDVVVVADHDQKKAWVISSGLTANGDFDSLQARKRLDYFINLLNKQNYISTIVSEVVSESHIVSNFTRDEYLSAVQKIIDHIRAGDIFEANIAQRFRCDLPQGLTPWQLFCRLRHINPAPFASYFNFGDGFLVSASPERFISVTNGVVETRPIKGTRPRGQDPDADRKLAEELLASEKDRAENIMIVDLMRNDLSRVCLEHSVQVPQLCALESFATVHHLVSVVNGQLREGTNCAELLAATFPGGSITGAPKIRTIELIAETEPHRRGPYCGCIGWVGANGDMDTAITIRTLVVGNEMISFHVGGAVVLDSDPCAEYEETLDKGRALRRALTEVIA